MGGMDPQDLAMCARHSGAQPGGGICAVCLQERLIQLWRGEGNFTWDMEEFSITPPVSKTPVVVDEQHEPEDPSPTALNTRAACFPVTFRLHRHEREKIDRSAGQASKQEFSCEFRSIVKELATLHEKRKMEKAGKKRMGSDRLPAAHVSQDPVSAPREPSLPPALPRAKANIVEAHEAHEADEADEADQADERDEADEADKAEERVEGHERHEDEDEEEHEARDGKMMCFSAVWPAIASLKWARVLVSPIVSSNKIAPSKSDLLSKLVTGMPRTTAGDAMARTESGRHCETSGAMRGHFNSGFDCPGPGIGLPGPLPARLGYALRPPAAEDGAGVELDKETKLRMEASRITVMSWLQSLPSPKAVLISDQTLHSPTSPGQTEISLDHGMLEMCDEDEELELTTDTHTDVHSEQRHRHPDFVEPVEPVEPVESDLHGHTGFVDPLEIKLRRHTGFVEPMDPKVHRHPDFLEPMDSEDYRHAEFVEPMDPKVHRLTEFVKPMDPKVHRLTEFVEPMDPKVHRRTDFVKPMDSEFLRHTEPLDSEVHRHSGFVEPLDPVVYRLAGFVEALDPKVHRHPEFLESMEPKYPEIHRHAGFREKVDPEVRRLVDYEEPVVTHISSFGKFLRSPSPVYAPSRMVSADIEIPAR